MIESQQKVYNFLVEYITREQFSPTIREIMTGVGLTSTGHASYCLDQLQKQGLITRTPGKAARIRLVSGEKAVQA